MTRTCDRFEMYTKWDSFTPRKYKINLIRTLTFRCFRICSSPSLLRPSLSELRKLLSQNGYPAGIVNYNINDVLNRQQNRQREQTTTVPKKEILVILPFLGLQSNVITKQLKACINKFYGCIDLRVIFQSNHCIKSFFPYTKTDSTVLRCQKLYIKLVVGTVRISTSEKQNVDYMTEKLNISKRSQVRVTHLLLLITSLQLVTILNGTTLTY